MQVDNFFGWNIQWVEMYGWNQFQNNYVGWKPHVHGWKLQKFDEIFGWTWSMNELLDDNWEYTNFLDETFWLMDESNSKIVMTNGND